MNFRSSLANAKGRGSARSGTTIWLWQRITALLLIPLVIWQGFILVQWADTGTDAVRQWIATPLHTVLLSATLPLLVLHGYLGFRTILEDYIHTTRLRFALLLLMRGGCLLLGMAALLALWHIEVTG